METISFSNFYTQYQLKRNPIELVTPYENTMFDFGDTELDYLEKQPINTIWSLQEDPNIDDFIITPGLQYKHIVGYFITGRPWISEDQKYILK